MQKRHREDVSIESLATFNHNKTYPFRRFLNTHKTLVHHFTPDLRQQYK